MNDYIQATIESSKRARQTLFTIVVASVIAFCPYWNSLEMGWMRRRPVITAEASALFGNPNPASLKLTDTEAAQAYLESRKIQSKKEIEIQNEAMNKAAVDLMRVRIPFFGVEIDVNDLGMFAGFTFVVLLLILRLSLIRQVSNLHLALSAAERSDSLRETYETIAMEQVMTLPPLSTKHDYGLLKYSARLLFLLPFLIQTLIGVRDAMTVIMGWHISRTLTIVVLVSEYTWLLLIIGLTWRCFKLSFETDEEWARWAGKMQTEESKLSSTILGR